MNVVGSSFFAGVNGPALAADGTYVVGPVVVWLHGEHDLASDDALCMTLARAIALGGTGLVLDLSDVDFIAVSTIGVIMRAREFLRHRAQSLTVRSPSVCARRALDVYGANDLLATGPQERSTEVPGTRQGRALGTWVDVPPAPREAERTPVTKAPERAERLARNGR